MAANGYVRQSSANIQPNLNINSADLNAEYNVLATAFDNTSGHDHSGSVAGDGAKIILTTSVTGTLPIANGGTGSTTATGAGLTVLQTSPTILTPTIASITGPTTIATGTLTSAVGIVVTTGGLTVTAGGANITGNSTVTGAFNATAGIQDNSNRVYSASNALGIYTANLVNPTGTSSATIRMAGLAIPFTPTKSTRILISIGGMLTTLAAGTISTTLYYGTGAAPANAAAVTGAALTPTLNPALNNVSDCFNFTTIVSGLTLSTAYWFDLTQATTGSTLTLTNLNVTIHEI